MTGQIDYRTLAARILKGENLLPERYTKAAFSKRRTSIYMLEYVAGVFNEGHRQNILRHYQLNERIFQEPDAPINILFPMDVCEYLKKFRLMDNEALQSMGRSSSLAARFPTILKPMSELKSVKEIHELMCTELMEKYFEKNYFYRLIRASEKECVILGLPNPEVEELLGLKNAGTSAICSVRNGFASSFPNFIGLPYSRVRKTACVHNGDPECRFEINYEHAERVMRSPKLNPNKVAGLWTN
jgi:hypothetical protein